MAIFVNTNVSSLKGRQYLNTVNNSLNTTYQRLSSGLRINSAKDDAAGLQISDRLTAQINGLNQGNRNANDAIALAQTIEGGLDEITNMLQRMRTLAVQANNGINTLEDRSALSNEAGQLTLEIERIANQTTYGGQTILAGKSGNSIFGAGNADTGSIDFQIGANSGDTISLNVSSFVFTKIANRALTAAKAAGVIQATDASNFGLDTKTGSGVGGVGDKKLAFALSDTKYTANAIKGIDYMLAEVSKQRAALGAVQNRLESSIRVQSNVATNESDARSRIRDTDFAEESANLSQQSIIQQAATSMLMQANARPQIGLSLLG